MAAEVDIVNKALSKLGEARISSLDDPSDVAALAASIYGTVRDDVMGDHNWHFAKHRVKLSRLAEKPAFEWAYKYLMPSDCLRILQAGPWPVLNLDGLVAEDRSAWTLEGRHILSNYGPTLNLIYLRREEDVAAYPPSFVEVLACKLAVEMSERLIGAGGKREMAWKEYDEALRRARRHNAIQLPPQPVSDGTWAASFYRGVM